MSRPSFFLLFLIIITFGSCSNISDKSVFEKLSTDELAKAIKSDTMFSSFYEVISEHVDKMDDIKRAKYNDVTYSRFFEFYKFLIYDTTYWNPLVKNWENEWEKEYGVYSTKGDSTISYWKKYQIENSLDKYVKVELVNINKKYYKHIGGIEYVSLGFRMTPLKGAVQQLLFEYGYKAKIHSEDYYYEKHRCIETDPLYSSRIGNYKVDYLDEDLFSGENIESFLRDYNVYIEVIEIRKDGVNISKYDLNIPDVVAECLKVEKEYPELFESYKKDLIIKLIRKDYVGKLEYSLKKSEKIQEKKDKLSYEFLKELFETDDTEKAETF
jgi:hypothetical protein